MKAYVEDVYVVSTSYHLYQFHLVDHFDLGCEASVRKRSRGTGEPKGSTFAFSTFYPTLHK